MCGLVGAPVRRSLEGMLPAPAAREEEEEEEEE